MRERRESNGGGLTFPLPDFGVVDPRDIERLLTENELLREEIRVAREAAEITASLVVKQFEETERILRRLQDANAQRKAVLDSATQIAIIATDIDGVVTVFNTGAENLLGYQASEVIGEATPEIFHLKSQLRLRSRILAEQYDRPFEGIEVFFEYARLGRNEQEEWTYIRKDGAEFPVTLSINALRDPDGELSGFLCIAMDITEKKRSERALAESERNYRLLIDNIPNIVFKGYMDGSIDFFDDKIEKLTGYPKELFLRRQMKWTDLVVDDDRPRVREAFIRALKGSKSYIREYRIEKKDGDILWIEACSQIICDEAGNVEFITGAFLDISERKQAEQALHESEEKYRSLFDSGPNPIFVLDRETLDVLDANPSAELTYGYSREELVGRCFEELGTFEYEKDFFSLSSADAASQVCITSQKMRHQRKDGEPLYVEIKACPATYRNRPAIILAATDVTETIEKDAQLFQASKMTTLGEMSAGIAHELNQPLNAIKIGNDFLKATLDRKGGLPEADLARVVKTVSEQVQRASGIINRLREFGRRPDFKKDLVSVNSVLQEVMSLIGQQLTLQNIEIRYDLATSLSPILVNKNHLEQVFFNLLTNARDAVEQCAWDEKETTACRITLSTAEEKNRIVCRVEDTGAGIPEGSLEKIFEPFYTTKEVGKGMGLGLAISYRIVNDFGGTIDVDSRPGKGTCFTLRFPKAPL